MKKRILAWSLVAMMVLAALSVTALAGEELVPLSTDIDITDSFTCPNFLAVVREITGVSEPNPIFSGHVNSITTVFAGVSGITSLTGIEHFTALSGLIVNNNHLTELDVSSNTALEWLLVRGNQLTELDMSNNIALERLLVAQNQLTVLDVSNNTALDDLDVSGNQLTELDVSNSTALTRLTVNENQLTELDVSNNAALRTLTAWANQLTELDVSNNTALTHLWVGENQLTELDVSNNTALGLLSVEYNNMTSPDDVIGWRDLFYGDATSYFSTFTFFPQRQLIPCPDCGAFSCECNVFGPVPFTGIPDISLAMYSMFALAALSAGLWASALRPKRRK